MWCSYIYGCGAICWSTVDLPDATVVKKTNSSYPAFNLSIAPQLALGLLKPAPQCWNVNLYRSCGGCDFLCAMALSYPEDSCTLSSPASGSYNTSTLLFQQFLSLAGRGCDMGVPFVAKHSTNTHFCTF